MGALTELANALKAAQSASKVVPAAEREANLAKFLAESKDTRRMYHGTQADISQFISPRKGVFVSPDPEFASNFSEGATGMHGPNVLPVRVQVKNPFDYDNPEHMKAIREEAKKQFPGNKSVQYDLDAISGVDDSGGMFNNWDSIEHPDIQRLIKQLGHDSYYTSENGIKNLGIYNPNKIKSDIGNQGTYDTSTPDITKADGGRIHLSLLNPNLKEHVERFAAGGNSRKDASVSEAVTQGLLPMLYGAGKGAVSGVLGAPGDLESFGRSVVNAVSPSQSVLGHIDRVNPETVLPTSESIANRLPSLKDFGAGKTAQHSENFGSGAARNLAGMAVGPESLLGLTKGLPVGASIKLVGDVPQVNKALNAADKIKPLESNYVTRQDGPFYRVKPTSPSASVNGATRQEIWGSNAAADARARREAGDGSAALFSHDALKDTVTNPETNLPWQLANKKTQTIHGRDYQTPEMPPSSAQKQLPVAKAFLAGAENNPAYKENVFKAYQAQHPELIEQTGAKNYDDLLKASYQQLAKETKDQFNSLPYEISFHRNGEGNYPNSAAMNADIHGNGHIYTFQGGNRHDFLHEVDPETGLNTNEMFRTVHDVFGHAIHGNQFGPKGEEIAWGAHQQMYSPLAVPAMSAETRGQNSVVNYSPLNQEVLGAVRGLDDRIKQIAHLGDTPDLQALKAEKKRLLTEEFQYAPQASVLLPPEMNRPDYNGFMPEYLKNPAESVTGPNSEAMRLAQQRAAAPVSMGGLGLAPFNTPEQRAAAMGFDLNTPQHHVTNADVDFSAIKPSASGKFGAGVYSSKSPKYAEIYADPASNNTRNMPLVTSGEYMKAPERDAMWDEQRPQNPNLSAREMNDLMSKQAQEQGYSGFDVGRERVTFNPDDVRSRFAAFDPWRRNAAIAAAMGVEAPDLLAKESDGNKRGGLIHFKAR